MKIEPSPDVLSAHLEGESVLLHMGTKRYFRLNGTAAAVWRRIERGPVSVEELTVGLGAEFGEPPEAVERDIEQLTEALHQRDLVTALPHIPAATGATDTTGE